MAKPKTFTDGQLLTAADVNNFMVPNVPAGKTTLVDAFTYPTPQTGFTIGTAYSERRGERFECYGYITVGTAFTLTGSLVNVCQLAAAPISQVIGMMSTNRGPVEYVIDGAGLLKLRYWIPAGSGTLTVPAGTYLSLGGISYRILNS